MSYEGIPIRQTVRAHPGGNAGSHDLLGTPPADAEQKLDSSAIHERAGQSTKLSQDAVKLAEPGRFCRHSNLLCYCAPAQDAKTQERMISNIILLQFDMTN
jgi:hypothetical protein